MTTAYKGEDETSFVPGQNKGVRMVGDGSCAPLEEARWVALSDRSSRNKGSQRFAVERSEHKGP